MEEDDRIYKVNRIRKPQRVKRTRRVDEVLQSFSLLIL